MARFIVKIEGRMPMTEEAPNKQHAIAQLRRRGHTGRIMEVRKIVPGGRRDGDKAWTWNQ